MKIRTNQRQGKFESMGEFTDFGRFSQSQEIGKNRRNAFTLMELLIVITILAILVGLLFPAVNAAIASARATVASLNLRDITNATLAWSMDHGNKIPSAQYPGGHQGELPPNAIPSGTRGLWCDGTIFKILYPDVDPSNPPPSRAEEGGHLVETSFENKASIKVNPDVYDWYQHSYAMNTNLVYDELNKDSPDPWLTEKSLANMNYLTGAMIFIDCKDNLIDQNKAMGEGEESLLSEAALRYRKKYVLAAFLDGHVEKIPPSRIPMGDINTDEDASRFWRGVNPRN